MENMYRLRGITLTLEQWKKITEERPYLVKGWEIHKIKWDSKKNLPIKEQIYFTPIKHMPPLLPKNKYLFINKENLKNFI